MVVVFRSPGKFTLRTFIFPVYSSAETVFLRKTAFAGPETCAVADSIFYKAVFNGVTSPSLCEGLVWRRSGDGITLRASRDGPYSEKDHGSGNKRSVRLL